MDNLFICNYFIELLTPKRADYDSFKANFNLFVERYYRILDLNLGISVPDNPMGIQRISLLEMIKQAQLPIESEKTIMNLNTFHSKDELTLLLHKALNIGIKYLLIVRGDGGPDFPRLDPAAIGGEKNIATSIDLIRYINSEYAGKFITGCVFNHYNAMPFESGRLKEKIKAGAKFIITQPVIGKNPNIDLILEFGMPVIIEAWLSKNSELLFKSVGSRGDKTAEEYDPNSNILALHKAYPNNCFYLSMLGFKTRWKEMLPKL